MPHKKRSDNLNAFQSASSLIYPTGLYVRLSHEEAEDGWALSNQKEFLLRFVEEQNDLKVVDTYSDNGETGTNFERPEWNRLMEDVRQKRITCIVVKDLSRFGRNYIETGNYLETVFPSLGVRFIAVTDRYDTNNFDANDLPALSTIIKGIVNEAYAKDISRKIFTTKELQRKNGQYYGNIPPYGYLKDPKDPHHLLINPETAPIVQQIFQWKQDCLSHSEIARRLNESSVPAPMRYQFLAGTVKAKRFEHSIWQRVTIKVILENRTYTGDLAMGKKRKNLSMNITKVHPIPYEDWTITDNTHEAIISRETFFEVQRICAKELEANRVRRYRHSEIENPEDIFDGLIYSKAIGLKMYRTRNLYEKYGVKYRYTTISQRDFAYTACSIVSIKEEQIEESLRCFLQKQVELILELREFLAEIKSLEIISNRKEELKIQIQEQAACQTEILNHQKSLHQDYTERLLNRNEYIVLKNQCNEKKLLCEHQLNELQSALNELELLEISKNMYMQSILEFHRTGLLTKELIQKLVGKIYVHDSRTIEIILRYKDELKPVIQFRESGVLE